MEQKNKPGRPKKDSSDCRDYVVTMRLTLKEGTMYKQIRDKMQMTESDFGRWMFLMVAKKLMPAGPVVQPKIEEPIMKESVVTPTIVVKEEPVIIKEDPTDIAW